MANGTEASQANRQRGQGGGVKETIESILIAFILAFTFRAFVVEAFVIPTGSMGPTLLGAHFRVTCPDCGYHFEKNYSTRRGADETNIPPYDENRDSLTLTCPNCGYTIPFSGMQPVYFGDRILVLKYRYLLQQPRPWDVVVFKSPHEDPYRTPKPDPADRAYVENYIKRLVALPGESIMILDGDVYIGSPGQRPQEFKIRRKAPHAQGALWRDVYDNDYLSRGISRETAPPWQEPWVVENGEGWSGPLGGGAASRVFSFGNSAGESAIRFDSTVNHNFDALTDWLAYDQSGSGTYVSDLKLSCVYRRNAGQGALTMQLTKNDDCFTVELLPGKVRLSRNKIFSRDPLRVGRAVWSKPLEAQAPELGASGKPVAFEISNVDYRVTVRVEGRDVLATTDEQFYPDVTAIYDEALRVHREQGRQSATPKPIARIVASRQSCSIEHLRLAKDVYYLNLGRRNDSNGVTTSDQPWWGSPENIMNLGSDEYFVLGDNSLVSLDARFWGIPVDLPREADYHVEPGRVPGRFLLGKAFFVYWPAGYRPPSLPYGIEPDFGDMRFIK